MRVEYHSVAPVWAQEDKHWFDVVLTPGLHEETIRGQERFKHWQASGSRLITLKLKLDKDGRKDMQAFTSKHNKEQSLP